MKLLWAAFLSKTLYPLDEGAASVEQSIMKTVPLSVTDDERFKKDTVIMSVSYFTSNTRYERMTENRGEVKAKRECSRIWEQLYRCSSQQL